MRRPGKLVQELDDFHEHPILAAPLPGQHPDG